MTEVPPETARDTFQFRRRDAILFDGLVAFFRRTGLWKYPVPAIGDLERMGFWDKVYWVYKCQYPVCHAERGAGLEGYFRRQEDHSWGLPPGFEAEASVELSAVGDLMNHVWLEGSGDTLYPQVADLIFDVELAMGNLECVVTAESQPLVLTTHTGAALTMSDVGLDIVAGPLDRRYGFLSTACNHSLDLGVEGVGSTARALRSREINFHGINEREEDAARACIIERNGIRIGILSWTFGLNGYFPPVERPLVVNRADLNGPPGGADLETIEEQLAHCKRAGVDFVVGQLHWGLEFEMYPRPEQLEMAHHLAELGMDAIIGHHPHVPQPVEWYRTCRDLERVVPIYYSLGNLTNPFAASFMADSLVARMTLARGRTRDGISRTYVREASATTVRQVADAERRVLSLVPAPGASEAIHSVGGKAP